MTSDYRKWQLLAAALMANHIHLVVRTPEDANPTKVQGGFNAYGSRALTARFGKPRSGTWWTYGGSKRLLPDERAIATAVHYVLHKQYDLPLAWSPEITSAESLFSLSGIAVAPRDLIAQRKTHGALTSTFKVEVTHGDT